ncbi:hypothetical protein HAX54_013638 [Datura stramonium]|uniref:RING-type E3 ubiquitin transferase n=1 Tax=Datura stramonium TaxID=4076 RepID=A0ABS8TPC7_DATST|nr:hypothetical protein [Datura stramonium]
MGNLKKQSHPVVGYVLFVFLFSCPCLIPKAVAQPPTAGTSAELSPCARRACCCAWDLTLRCETFPTFTYAEVKDHQIGKGALECAVCLNEFEDNETLRLIPKCDHVFIPSVLMLGLQSHDTCPVCRANLNLNPGEPPVQVPEMNREGQDERVTEQHNSRTSQVSIRIIESEAEFELQRAEPGSQASKKRGSVKSGVKRNLSFNVPIRPPRSISMRPRIFSKFRSHSTGHSLVLPGENLDRYTLRLPDDVRKEVVNRALLNRAKSWAPYKETQAPEKGIEPVPEMEAVGVLDLTKRLSYLNRKRNRTGGFSASHHRSFQEDHQSNHQELELKPARVPPQEV